MNLCGRWSNNLTCCTVGEEGEMKMSCRGQQCPEISSILGCICHVSAIPERASIPVGVGRLSQKCAYLLSNLKLLRALAPDGLASPAITDPEHARFRNSPLRQQDV